MFNNDFKFDYLTVPLVSRLFLPTELGCPMFARVATLGEFSVAGRIDVSPVGSGPFEINIDMKPRYILRNISLFFWSWFLALFRRFKKMIAYVLEYYIPS